ncbi:uncharacterized protein LY89DRAFT_682337 [Mollisia scopiformis]|uniref:Uncharacterized protein n=1 Tax=Mollisia scopiformis TaxID=149040 RepID=A0A194XKJ4_MOLSC|nr:uncharacterized protein LY89DRAFT_682337 [Mollisia scopiformis]KUJ20629.1 hypothetical protein LY89DRAFT_682337 [Mollisia scopiformis]
MPLSLSWLACTKVSMTWSARPIWSRKRSFNSARALHDLPLERAQCPRCSREFQEMSAAQIPLDLHTIHRSKSSMAVQTHQKSQRRGRFDIYSRWRRRRNLRSSTPEHDEHRQNSNLEQGDVKKARQAARHSHTLARRRAPTRGSSPLLSSRHMSTNPSSRADPTRCPCSLGVAADPYIWDLTPVFDNASHPSLQRFSGSWKIPTASRTSKQFPIELLHSHKRV